MNNRIILSLVFAVALIFASISHTPASYADTVSGQTQTATGSYGYKCSGGTLISSYSDYEPEGGCWGCDTATAPYPVTCGDQMFQTTEYINHNISGSCSVSCSTYSGTTSVAVSPGSFRTTTGPLGHTTSTTWSATQYSYSTTTVSATLVANPTTVSSGGTSLLTWSSSGATTCTGTGFSTGNATTGSVTVTPATTTTYTVSCVNGSLTATDSKTVTVQNLLSVSCVAAPNPGTVYQSVNWTSSVSGANGVYTYSWSGSDSLSGSSSSVSKTYTTTGAKTATLTVTSGSSTVSTQCNNTVCQTSSCTCSGASCGVTVNEGSSSDLTAGTPTLHSGLNETGNTATFEASVINSGNNSINASFPNRFQVDTNSDGTWDTNLDVASTAYSLGLAGTALVVSPPWTNLPAGTHLVRLCADSPTSAVTESNEGNNCGSPLTFSVGASPLTLNITANPTRAHKGGTTLLTWTSTNADSCTVTGSGFSASGLSGSQNATVTADTTYTLRCVRGASTFTKSVTVQLAPAFEEI